MTETTHLRADKPVPLGLAIGVLATIMLGGAAAIFYYVHRPAGSGNVMRVITPPAGNPKVIGTPGQDAAANFDVVQAAGEADLPDGIHPDKAGDTLFKAGDAYLRVIRGDGEPRYTFGFFTVKEIEWDHGYITQGIRRILTQEDFAKEIGVTDGQKKQLEELPAAPSAKWAQADRERFISQYQGWSTASGDAKAKAGEAFLKALRIYGEEKRSADQKLMVDRVTRAKAILTEKQVARINPIPKWEVKGAPPSGK